MLAQVLEQALTLAATQLATALMGVPSNAMTAPASGPLMSVTAVELTDARSIAVHEVDAGLGIDLTTTIHAAITALEKYPPPNPGPVPGRPTDETPNTVDFLREGIAKFVERVLVAHRERAKNSTA